MDSTSWRPGNVIRHSSHEKEHISEIKGDQQYNSNPGFELKLAVRSSVYDA